MSVARITTITFNSKEAADIAKKSYVENSPNDFPEAEQLLGIQTDGNILIAVPLYADNEAMERATTARKKALDSNQEVVSVDTKVGFVELNHIN